MEGNVCTGLVPTTATTTTIPTTTTAMTTTTACIKQHLDYGAQTSDECGLAPMVKIIATNPIFPDWFTGPTAVDTELGSALDCQVHCAETDGCDFFGYREFFDDGVHHCYMKQAVLAGCPEYSAWSGEGWAGASGPRVCQQTTAAHTTTTTNAITTTSKTGGSNHCQSGHTSFGGHTHTLYIWV